MQRLVRLLVSLVLAVTLGLGGIAHASEGPEGERDAGCAALVGHHEGDRDQSLPDLVKAYPHHHAECHCHLPGVPVAAEPLLTPGMVSVCLRPFDAAPPGLAVIDPEPRPPRA